MYIKVLHQTHLSTFYNSLKVVDNVDISISCKQCSAEFGRIPNVFKES